jgi:outer membrane protein assembly factor BamB
MKPQRAFLLILVALAAIGAIAGLLLDRTSRGQHVLKSTWDTDGEALRSFSSGEGRVWWEVEHRLLQIPSNEKLHLVKPTTLRVDAGGNVYLTDWQTLRILKFSPDGLLVCTYGEGKGSAPGQFLNPSDFDVAGNGEVWVCDTRNERIEVFRPDGSQMKSIPVETGPMRILVLRSDIFVVSPTQGEDLFAVFDTTGRKLASFGRFIEDQEGNKIALDGWIARAGGEKFIYTPVYAGLIASFLPSGHVGIRAQTTEEVNWPVLYGERGRTYIDGNRSPVLTLSVSCDDSNIFLVNKQESMRLNCGVIDAYDLRDGSYEFSFRVPEMIRGAVVTHRSIYTLGDSTVSVWQRSESRPNHGAQSQLKRTTVSQHGAPVDAVTQAPLPGKNKPRRSKESGGKVDTLRHEYYMGLLRQSDTAQPDK